MVYSAHDLLMKNKDPVSQDLLVLLQHSSSAWIKSLFSSGTHGGGGSGSPGNPRRKDTRFKGVAAKFQQQLEELLTLVGFSDLHFVRCVKPNQKKAPRAFEPDMVETQLRSSGVFEAVRVIGMGFPTYYGVTILTTHSSLLTRCASLACASLLTMALLILLTTY